MRQGTDVKGRSVHVSVTAAASDKSAPFDALGWKLLWFLTESAIAYKDKWARPLFESKKVFSRLCGSLAVKLHVEYGRLKEMLRINMVFF